jgi:hypothetical protein
VNGAAKAYSSSRPNSRMAAVFIFLSFRAGSGCNHTETCAGCIVSLTTLVKSSLKAPRSVSSRSLAEKASSALAAVVLAAVEAPVYERLDASPKRSEEDRDHKRGDDDRELGLLRLAGDEDKQPLL